MGGHEERAARRAARKRTALPKRATRLFGRLRLGRTARDLPPGAGVDPLVWMRRETEAVAVDLPQLEKQLMRKVEAGCINAFASRSVAEAFQILLAKSEAERRLDRARVEMALQRLLAASEHREKDVDGILEVAGRRQEDAPA